MGKLVFSRRLKAETVHSAGSHGALKSVACAPVVVSRCIEADRNYGALRRIHARKKARARKALLKDIALDARITALLPSLTPLQRRKVKEATQRVYMDSLMKLLSYLGRRDMPAWPGKTWDTELSEYSNQLYHDGEHVSMVNRIMSAVVWAQPSLGTPLKRVFPMCTAGAQGWSRAEPGGTRPPLPYVVVLQLVRMAAVRAPLQALLMLLLFETYLRVGAALSMVKENFVPRTTVGGALVAPAAIVLHTGEQDSSKTGERDICVPLDLDRHQQVALLLEKVANARRPGQRLWDFDYDQFRKTFHMCMREAGIVNSELVIHCLRHGGATHDRMVGARTLEEVRRRGCWASHSSVKRYEKTALVGKVLQRLPPTLLEVLQRQSLTFEKHFHKTFAGLFDAATRGKTKCTSTSSLEPEESHGRCAGLATQHSSGTSLVACSTTSRTLKRSLC